MPVTNLFQREIEYAEEQERQQRVEMQRRLGQILIEQELFSHPSWPLYQARLRMIEYNATEALIGANPEHTRTLQERVKVARHLLEVPVNLEIEAAQLRSALEAESEEE